MTGTSILIIGGTLRRHLGVAKRVLRLRQYPLGQRLAGIGLVVRLLLVEHDEVDDRPARAVEALHRAVAPRLRQHQAQQAVLRAQRSE